jgi:hypothetical protein
MAKTVPLSMGVNVFASSKAARISQTPKNTKPAVLPFIVGAFN